MDTQKTLLERMASISPGVRAHLGGEIWQIHIEEDEISTDRLVQECFSILIDEAYELGLEFFCQRADLCDTLYHVDLTMLFFEVVFPTPLYRNLCEDDGFKRWIIATSVDGAGKPGEQTAPQLLFFLAYYHPTAGQIFEPCYEFLQDKLRSTPVFDTYLAAILSTDILRVDVPTDPTVLERYLTHVKADADQILRAFDRLLAVMPELESSSEVLYNRLRRFKEESTLVDLLADRVWAADMIVRVTPPPTPAEQALTERITRQFFTSLPFFEEYFSLLGIPLTQADIACLVVGCLARAPTKASFLTEATSIFQRVGKLLPLNDPATRTFIAAVCFNLAQEFYP